MGEMTVWTWMSLFSIGCSVFSITMTMRISRQRDRLVRELRWWKHFIRGYSPTLAASIRKEWQNHEVAHGR